LSRTNEEKIDSMEIRVLEAQDAAIYQTLRLEALRVNPEAFGSTYEREAAYPLDAVAGRIAPTLHSFTLGAFLKSEGLVGSATFVRETNVKTAHKGNIYGVYVSTEARGKGIGKALIVELLKQAGTLPGLEQINLTVVSGHAAAKKLYAALGFTVYGTERRALRHNGAYFDEELMVYRYDFA